LIAWPTMKRLPPTVLVVNLASTAAVAAGAALKEDAADVGAGRALVDVAADVGGGAAASLLPQAVPIIAMAAIAPPAMANRARRCTGSPSAPSALG